MHFSCLCDYQSSCTTAPLQDAEVSSCSGENMSASKNPRPSPNPELCLLFLLTWANQGERERRYWRVRTRLRLSGNIRDTWLNPRLSVLARMVWPRLRTWFILNKCAYGLFACLTPASAPLLSPTLSPLLLLVLLLLLLSAGGSPISAWSCSGFLPVKSELFLLLLLLARGSTSGFLEAILTATDV